MFNLEIESAIFFQQRIAYVYTGIYSKVINNEKENDIIHYRNYVQASSSIIMVKCPVGDSRHLSS